MPLCWFKLATGNDIIPVYYDHPNPKDKNYGFPTVLRESVNSMVMPSFEIQKKKNWHQK